MARVHLIRKPGGDVPYMIVANYLYTHKSIFGFGKHLKIERYPEGVDVPECGGKCVLLIKRGDTILAAIAKDNPLKIIITGASEGNEKELLALHLYEVLKVAKIVGDLVIEIE